ncbi:VC1465 family Xer recombination activation factor [Comamonas aquatica]|uniref:VC1465 family Xer recombination activation factor n=1 Tax=Comamonas aquatica TaxID=225991 RepID=UPI0009DFB7B6|nr:VC1465 family Xer recombination activation factor [Comamonas aquatica]
MQLASRFKAMYQSLGMDLAACAKYLHVTERTLHNWLSGKHDIPFAAYKLLRLLNRMDLPGQAWDGWCFRSGKLWSPEGRSFDPVDASWWGLLVRRAHAFEYHARRVGLGASRTAPGKLALHGAGSEAPGPTAAAVGRREAPALDLSHRHFGTQEQQTEAASGFRVRYDLSYQPLFNARKELP